jgi:hypothetical protein
MEESKHALAKAVLEWAKTPGDHGGNPYCKPFVKLAREIATAGLRSSRTDQDMIEEAKDLLEPGEESRNQEYLRGMCELIARCFPREAETTGDRAEQIAREIGGTLDSSIRFGPDRGIGSRHQIRA